jgi:hypothetical protein
VNSPLPLFAHVLTNSRFEAANVKLQEMGDFRIYLNRLRAQADACETIRDRATDQEKRSLFDRLARHHRELVRHVEGELARNGPSIVGPGGDS